MRIGLISDAHGNPVALTAALQMFECHQVDEIYFLGDAVGYLPGETEVLHLLRAGDVHCQKGNHEAMLLGEISFTPEQDRLYRLGAARKRLTCLDFEMIASWPDHRVVSTGGKQLLLVHGAPDNYLEGYVYPQTDVSHFGGLGFDAVFMGHTHYPFVSKCGELLIANVGSCGLPRDEGDLLACAIYDERLHDCTVYRLRFDRNQIVRQFGLEAISEEASSVLFRKCQKVPFGQRVALNMGR